MTGGPRHGERALMTPIGPGGGVAASFSHHRGGGAAGQAPVVDPGDPPRDRGHSRGAGHRHRNPPGGAGQFPRDLLVVQRTLPRSAATKTPSPPGSPFPTATGDTGPVGREDRDPTGVVASSSRAWARSPCARPSASRHPHDHSPLRHGGVRLAIPVRHRRSDMSWKASLATKLADDDRHGDPARPVRGANQCACRHARAATRTLRPIELSSRSPRITPSGGIPG